jgi:hypothetical protein
MIERNEILCIAERKQMILRQQKIWWPTQKQMIKNKSYIAERN